MMFQILTIFKEQFPEKLKDYQAIGIMLWPLKGPGEKDHIGGRATKQTYLSISVSITHHPPHAFVAITLVTIWGLDSYLVN